jgi:hypothetical protein
VFGAPARSSFWLGAVFAFLGLGAIVGILFATGTLQLRGTQNTPAITQRAEAPAPITAKGPKQMPDDIRAWLEHLERIERKRVELTQAQLVQVTVMGTQLKGLGIADVLGGMFEESESTESKPPELRKAEGTVADVRKPWADLADEFGTLPPPPGCQEVAISYDQALRETGATMGDILDAMNGAMENPQAAIQALQKIRGEHMGSIDESAGRADRGVQAICDAYDTRKWFTIQRDIGGGMPTLTVPGGGLGP